MKKFTKKLIVMLLCVALIGAWLPMTALAAPAQNSGGVYEIGSADDLNWFAQQVNGGNAGINAVLTADITLTGTWTPIGTADVQYAGTFDGAGHAISGLSCTGTTAGYVGLIGCLAAGGTVKNVTVSGSVSGKSNVGGVVGYSYGGSIIGCRYSGTVTSASGGAGGIVGYARTGTVIDSCTVSGTVSGGGSNTGGIAGYCGGTISGCENKAAVTCTTSGVGGIVGWLYNGTVKDCTNSGNVSSTATTSSANAGGIAGNASGSISGCTNSGNVTGTATIGGIVGQLSKASAVTESSNSGTITGTLTTKGQVGGIVGYAYGQSGGTVAVTKCCNTGKVTGGYQFTGGIAGQANYSEIDNCYNLGSITGGSTYAGGVVGGFSSSNNTLSNSYSTGTVSGGKSYVGAVTGSNQGTITNCYYVPGTATDARNAAQNGTGNAAQGSATADAAGATVSKTTAQFASGEVCYLLNGSTSEGDLVWFQTIGTDATPKFRGAVVYFDSATGGYANDPGEITYVAYNEDTETSYATVAEALDEAKAGETVILLTNASTTTALVAPGVTLDLKGFNLTATFAVGFDTAHIIDSVGTGSLITALDNLVLDRENAMVPVYNGNAYVFTKAGFAIRKDTTYTGEGVKINAMAYPVNMDVVELLEDGGADNNIRIVVQLSWSTEQGTGSQQFLFKDSFVAAVYSSNNGTWDSYGKSFVMTITGTEGIENLSARIALVSDTNVEYVSSNAVDLG